MNFLDFAIPQIPFWQAWFGTGFIYATIAGIWLHDNSHPMAWANTAVTWAVKFCIPLLMAFDIIGFLNRKK